MQFKPQGQGFYGATATKSKMDILKFNKKLFRRTGANVKRAYHREL